MIQLIAGCIAFHSEFSKTKIEVQDVISSSSLDETLISSSPWTRKWVKNTRNQTAHETVVYKVRISWNSTGEFLRREELYIKKRIWAQPFDLTDSSRSRVVMMCRFVNWCRKLVIVRSQMDGRGESTYLSEASHRGDHPLDLHPMIVRCWKVHWKMRSQPL